MNLKRFSRWRASASIRLRLYRLAPVWGALAIFIFLAGFNVFFHNHDLDSGGRHDDCPVCPLILILDAVLASGLFLLTHSLTVSPAPAPKRRVYLGQPVQGRVWGRAPPIS